MKAFGRGGIVIIQIAKSQQNVGETFRKFAEMGVKPVLRVCFFFESYMKPLLFLAGSLNMLVKKTLYEKSWQSLRVMFEWWYDGLCLYGVLFLRDMIIVFFICFDINMLWTITVFFPPIRKIRSILGWILLESQNYLHILKL